MEWKGVCVYVPSAYGVRGCLKVFVIMENQNGSWCGISFKESLGAVCRTNRTE